MYKSKNPIFHLSEELAEQILQATEYQIDELLDLVETRYNQLHPEREGVFLSLARDPAHREAEIAFIVRLLTDPK